LSQAEGSADFAPVSYLLGLDLRVLAVARHPDPAEQARTILDMLRRLPALPPPHPGSVQAPVLVLPDVFEPALCRRLVEGYEAEGGAESGFMRERDGKTVLVVDHQHKRRSDWIIADEPLRETLRRRVLRRIVPEIQRAFQFKVTRMERYIVACYDAAVGGHFQAHRDNTTRGTAHRRFAVTINLNSEAYEGGALMFPEYGRAIYRPPTGGAVVFSCGLLHQALPVTRGKRYAFLPFLYDDAAARIREANNAFLGENIAAYRAGTKPTS
jgi:predicted 2-oxoglutarate/Fe(II)-dependent dioxygenase YbiX